MDVVGILSAASAVGDPTRLRMLLRLSGGALSVGQLARAVDIAQPSASYHLRRLRQAELSSPPGSAVARSSGDERRMVARPHRPRHRIAFHSPRREVTPCPCRRALPISRPRVRAPRAQVREAYERRESVPPADARRASQRQGRETEHGDRLSVEVIFDTERRGDPYAPPAGRRVKQ